MSRALETETQGGHCASLTPALPCLPFSHAPAGGSEPWSVCEPQTGWVRAAAASESSEPPSPSAAASVQHRSCPVLSLGMTGCAEHSSLGPLSLKCCQDQKHVVLHPT